MYPIIAIFLGGDAGDGVRFDVARKIASSSGRVVGVHVVPTFPPHWGLSVKSVYEPLVEMQQRYNTAMLERSDEVHRSFEAALSDRVATLEWRFAFGDIAPTVAGQARCADILVAGPAGMDKGGARSSEDLPAQIAIEAGRPVLAVPAEPDLDALSRCVVVAWNGSRESARAIADAMPILKKAERVILLHIVDGDAEPPLDDVAAYLAGHGVAVIMEDAQTRASVDDAILTHAANRSAGLIVMGAYGHSRLRETVLGGATRDVLRYTTVPVLLSH